MITGAIKNKVDKIWTDIWAGGITQPLTVIEQLTYLMFIRSLDEKEIENEVWKRWEWKCQRRSSRRPQRDKLCAGPSLRIRMRGRFLSSSGIKSFLLLSL